MVRSVWEERLASTLAMLPLHQLSCLTRVELLLPTLLRPRLSVVWPRSSAVSRSQGVTPLSLLEGGDTQKLSRVHNDR